MKYGSVCSGIEAATVAWEPLGWKPAWFSEIDKFPSAVLAHHYPEVPNYGDFTRIRDDNHPADRDIDLLVGGTPCQSFSIAGLRGGLDDDRGQLALEFMRLVGALRPRWVVWENVPGALSSNGGRDFGSILGALAELGYGFAWRVLDAQHYGVPQRRRRVFLVGHSGGSHAGPAAVLFEPEGLRRDSAPSRKARQGTAGSAGDGVATVCGDVTHTLRAEGFDASEDGTGRGTPIIGFGRQENLNFKAEEEVSGPLTKSQTQAVAFSSKDYGSDALIEISPTLRSGSHSRSHANGGAPPAIAFSFDGGQSAAAKATVQYVEEGTAPLIKARPHCVAYDMRGREGGSQLEGPHETANIRAANGGSSRSYVLSSGVRRLTPVECERLQGFPDGYTDIRPRGKDTPDGPRYKALGNSMAVPVMRWIGQRIQLVDTIMGDSR